MSWDVYYKGLDLEQVRKVRQMALVVCVLIQSAAVCLQFSWAAHHWGNYFPGEQCS